MSRTANSLAVSESGMLIARTSLLGHCLLYTTCRKSYLKKGQKQVKKKAFKINAKIEDVGLTEETRNGH